MCIYIFMCTYMHDKKGSWDKAVVRTGHEVKDIHTSFHYLLGGSKTAIDAAKLVQGWTHPDDDKCLPATCDSFMTPENKELVIALVRKLFNQRWSILDSHLNRFVMNMFAMLLKSLPERISEFGEGTLVNKILIRAAKTFKIKNPSETFQKWGNLIRSDFEIRNASSFKKSSQQEIKELREQINNLSKQNEDSHKIQNKILAILLANPHNVKVSGGLNNSSIYIYMILYIYIHSCYASLCLYLHICINVYIYIHIYIYIYVYIHVCTYTYIYIYYSYN
jgi:hypothetical protein